MKITSSQRFFSVLYTLVCVFIFISLVLPSLVILKKNFLPLSAISLYRHFIPAFFSLLAVSLCLVSVYAVLKYSNSNNSLKYFLPGIISGTLLLRLLYILLADPVLYSDLHSMWEAAYTISNSGGELSENIFKNFIGTRTLPYLLPLVKIFGASSIVYKTGNVVLLMLSSLICFDLTRRWFNTKTALICLVFLAFIPELYFASAVTSHDIPGTFFLLLAFYLANLALENIGKHRFLSGIALSIPASLNLLLMEIQRNTRIFFFLTFVIFLVLYSARIMSRKYICLPAKVGQIVFLWISIIAIPFPASVIMEKYAKYLLGGHLGVEKNDIMLRSIAYRADPRYPGSASCHHRDRIIYALPSQTELRNFAVRRTLSHFYYEFPAKIRSLVQNAGNLFNLGSQDYLYYKKFSRKSILKGERTKTALTIYNLIFNAFFLLLFVSGFSFLAFSKFIPARALSGLIFVAILAAVFICICWTTQPRYLFPLWFFASAIISCFIHYLFKEYHFRMISFRKKFPAALREATVNLSFIIFPVSVILVLFFLLIPYSGLIYSDISGKWNMSEKGKSCFFRKTLQVPPQYKDSTASFSEVFPVVSTGKPVSVELFARGASLKAAPETWNLDIMVNGLCRKKIKYPNNQIKHSTGRIIPGSFVKIEGITPRKGQTEIGFRLSPANPAEADKSNSAVNIEYFLIK